jgi:hypothetical protein
VQVEGPTIEVLVKDIQRMRRFAQHQSGGRVFFIQRGEIAELLHSDFDVADLDEQPTHERTECRSRAFASCGNGMGRARRTAGRLTDSHDSLQFRLWCQSLGRSTNPIEALLLNGRSRRYAWLS